MQGSTPGLHAIFTGEDDTWDAWLKIPSSGFSGTVHFRGTGIKLRRGYAPSQSPKPTHDELRQQIEEEMDDYYSQNGTKDGEEFPVVGCVRSFRVCFWRVL
ncbi:shoot gravitropism 2 (SGR2) [Artemisia annua]|uniref:Shoot gravitropism 2 (SGR2) n=1 Tax=Artemisia annua TaxID=35608 RepID=A0A2U1MJ97_ARTAN|nr:shoot gravitropism 2 (SGR2) [Artemisia annua]